MYQYERYRELFVCPAPEGEDLLVYGIRKVGQEFRLLTISQTMSPEGADWTFVYEGKTNTLIIRKREATYTFSGDVSPAILEALKTVFGAKTSD